MRKTLARSAGLWVALLALAMFAACGGGEEKKPAQTAPAAAEPAPAPEPAPAAAPAEAPAPAAAAATGAGSPWPCIGGDAQKGKLKYAQICATCHGATGAGDGVASEGLIPKPAHHDDGNYMNPLSNEHLTKVITEGGASVGKSALMAAWGPLLGPQGVQDVIAYVRTLARPPYACP